MAINIKEDTVNVIQTLVRDGFNTNSILDRVKTQLTTTMACPILGNMVHMLAHKYPINMADKIGDLIEAYNEPIKYGDIPRHEENYYSPIEAIKATKEAIITYQNELNGAYLRIMQNGDIHTLVGLEEIIEEHNKYVERVILWYDIVEKYGDNPNLDIAMKEYDF